ncbi:hypothetical protein SEUBUCD646_0K02310 [Saccharomyces eubayanus]|uniref:Nucleolar protein Dnt1-like N-terminal domain-containing protein n=1 Tax=Saccharomyces eubayanus TaxID=1080349 RepID=A0ABN8VJ28_SACEU|nr:hypothetical protein SEUBUCD650_0K02300 [Saccharomyces eubayanus]CAI1574303.1 hypothetical protein SEUBUCD646_0K02310 [Saccharomyces eubayanus]
MWRLQIVLVPPSARDAILLLEANTTINDTSQQAFPMLQHIEDHITNSNNKSISNNDNDSSSVTSSSSRRMVQSNDGRDILNFLPNCKKFLHFTNDSNTLLQLSSEILTKVDKLYPDFNQAIEIVSLQDRHGCDLDSQFMIKDVFKTDGIVLVILKDELDCNESQQVSVFQIGRQRKRINNNSPARRLSVTERKKKIPNEDLSSTPNKDSMHPVAKNSLRKNFINKSRVSTPLMNEILPVANSHEILNKEKAFVRASPVILVSNAHTDLPRNYSTDGETKVHEGDNNKENIPSYNEKQENRNTKSLEAETPDEQYNSSDDHDFEPTLDSSQQVSYDSIDTDFQLSNTSSTNSDMHMQHFKSPSMVRSPRKSSLEIKVQNKRSENLSPNDKDVSENYRRIENFSDEEDLNDMDNSHADSFVNNSKKASMNFRDVGSDLENVSFTSDINDAVQSTQTTKNAVSPSSSSKNNNRQNPKEAKEELFNLIENEFPDKSSVTISAKPREKSIKIQETIRILNRFKPIEDAKTQKKKSITESSFRKFPSTIGDKAQSNILEDVHKSTKDNNKSIKVGTVKVKRMIVDAEAKVREFKKKRNMGNKSLKDIFANAGRTSKANSSIKVVKLTRDPVDNSKGKTETVLNSGLQVQNSDMASGLGPSKESTPEEVINRQTTPFSIPKTSSSNIAPHFKTIKVTRSNSSSSSSSSISSASSSDGSSADESHNRSNARNIQVRKLSLKTFHEPIRDSSDQRMSDVEGDYAKKYQTPKYIESDKDDE